MIEGILTFKPNKGGTVSIMIDGDPKDIIELSKLYGKKVSITESREQAEVQSPAKIMAQNIMHKLDAIMDEVRAWVEGEEQTTKEVIIEEAIKAEDAETEKIDGGQFGLGA